MVRPVGTCIRPDNSLLTPDEWSSVSIDLSKATKLEDVAFQLSSWNAEWVITALQTITPNHRDFRRILIHIPYPLILPFVDHNIRRAIAGVGHGYLSLDRLLVQFWESRPARPTIICVTRTEAGQDLRDCVGWLLPETSREMIVTDHFDSWIRPGEDMLTVVAYY